MPLTNGGEPPLGISVRCASTTNVTISTALNSGDTIDGITLVNGDLVLLKDQSTTNQNGVYQVGPTPVRFRSFDRYNDHPGRLISVEQGTANADTIWLCTSNRGGTLGATAIAFAQQTPLGGVSAFALTLLDDANAAAARATLEFATTTTDNAIVRFDGTAGKTQNSGVTVDDNNNIVSANGIRSRQIVVADDAATSFALNGIGGGIVAILALVAGGGADSGLVVVRTTSAVSSAILAAGATIAVSTGALTGTTGTDGKITVSPHTDGNVYVENRSGGSMTMGITAIMR